MSKPTKVYAVWSGARGRQIALLLGKWMPIFLQGAVDCRALTDGGPDARHWGPEHAKRLDESEAGIICVLPENKREEWIHFGAGALARTVEDRRIFCLCFDVEPDDLPPTLRQFHATPIEKENFLEFLETISERCALQFSKKDIEEAFGPLWNVFAAEMRIITGEDSSSDADEKPVELPLDQMRILLWFVEHPLAKPTSSDLSRDLNIHPEATEFHLNELLDNDYIANRVDVDDGIASWHIHQDGRKVLHTVGLLK